MAKGQNKQGKSETETGERRRRALELRKAGYGYQEIADQLGISNPGNAYRIVQNALKATYREPADEVRKLELERLDRLMRAIWEQAIEGDGDSIDRILRLMSRRARLLGLDLSAPEGSAMGLGSMTVNLRMTDSTPDPDPTSEPIPNGSVRTNGHP